MTHDELTATTKVKALRERIAEAKRAGVRIRSEWLAGETGGGCEIAGTRWVFLDLSLSVDEQLTQLEEAMASFDSAARPESPHATSPHRETAPVSPRGAVDE